ncbi:MAG: METTL5 family protein [Methanosarcinales archaeon]
MRQRNLEIQLERVAGFNSPSTYLEQYSTPATLAAELVFFAFMRNDLIDPVYDLGCGTGIIAIAAALMGAEKVVGFDIDKNALYTAKKNALGLHTNIDFVCCRVEDVPGKVHTVIMNPPFGAQIKGSDRPFLRKALDIADVIYSIHNTGSYDFIKKFIDPAVITDRYNVGFPIKRTFKFHKKDMEVVNVEIYRIENRFIKRDYH